MIIKYLTFFFLSFSAFSQSPGDVVDIFIAQFPAKLTIYNKYEQKIDFNEEKQFLPYQPFQMLERDGFLSDQFTPCMKIRLKNEDFYFIKNDSGLVNSAQAGEQYFFEECTFLGDTVEVLAEERLFIVKIPTFEKTMASQHYFLEKGAALRRLFNHPTKANYVYVEKLDDARDFGWAYLSAQRKGASWQPFLPKNAATATLTAPMIQNIRFHIDEVNGTLEQLFVHFNREANAAKPPPRWEMTVAADSILCEQNIVDYQNAFPESTRYLINRIENSLLGTAFGVFQENARIVIRQKK